ncbi:MAG: class I SAM-dependent methyltransferase [Chloroflexi bacterium]|nr:class I SAM-dependent methyltransferase [Chloroflexota bacterium]
MPYQVFDRHASEYDAWYDTEAGKAIFAMEVACLQPLLHKYGRPYLEVGVGPGRFAQTLGIEFGVDPAPAMVDMARARGIKVTEATGEGLPFPDRMFGGLLLAFTLCFLDNPRKALYEAWRVLQSGGGLVLGLILRDSPWTEFYTLKGKKGHPIYNHARFFSKEEAGELLHACGFKVLDYRSALFQPPGQSTYQYESPLSGYWQSAGFVVIDSVKQEVSQ